MEAYVLRLCQEALFCSIWLSAPAAIAALVVGLVVSIVQTATQIQEQTLTYVPKLAVVGLVLLVGGSWMLAQLVRFAISIFEQVPLAGKW